ncbi:hypothetical protein NC653_008380 [Populus alba x Populus x berolinensis]|uniref:Uncharacterized protein n=1 Tax=Populus alba x Populus x berolinensis TaxID=444605 RepID=A0AAD6R6M0_9ROSI|nr:hypothetical protein NC653_008380 [Populus alba x Populus x berolinensis]
MTSPHGHVQPDEYVPSSQYSQFAFNDYETPVDRILLSDNPSRITTVFPLHDFCLVAVFPPHVYFLNYLC